MSETSPMRDEPKSSSARHTRTILRDRGQQPLLRQRILTERALRSCEGFALI